MEHFFLLFFMETNTHNRCAESLQLETVSIIERLSNINRHGFLTINSQPQLNGVDSEDPVFGWGGSGGVVYQKSYLEFFTSKKNFNKLKYMIETHELNGTVFSKNDCLNYIIKIIFYTCQSYIYYPISLSHGILFYSTFFFFEKHIFRKLCLNYHQIFITINVTYIYITFSWNTLILLFFGNTCS